MALPVAYLVVMWICGVDPFGIGSRLGEKLPFLVPAGLRAEAEPDDDDAPSATVQNFLALEDEEDDEESFDSGFGNLDVGGRALEDFGF